MLLQQFDNVTDKFGGKVDVDHQPAADAVRPLRLSRRRHLRPAADSAAVGRRRQRRRPTSPTSSSPPARPTSRRRRRCSRCASAGRRRRPARIRSALGSASALDAYGITGLPTDPRVAGGLPTQIITGLTDLGRQATNPQWQYPTVYNPKVNYTWIAGRHSLKSGYEFQHIQTEVQDVNPLYGRDQLHRPVHAAGRRRGQQRLQPLRLHARPAQPRTRSATSWSPTCGRTCTSSICRTTSA